MLRDLVTANRTCRRFYQDRPVKEETLKELVDLARLAPSAANRQPLKYFISCDPEKNRAIFPHLGWAGYLQDWPGPEDGERPAAYIVILHDLELSSSLDCDHGIAAQTIMLGAREKGLGGTIVAAIRKKELSRELDLPPGLEIKLVLALGAPKETVKPVPMKNNNVKYWRDADGVHYVPKRSLDEILIG